MNTKVAIVASFIMTVSGFLYAADESPSVTKKSTSSSYRPSIMVYKNHHCDCCVRWVEYLIANRFAVKVESVDDLGQVKRRVGIPRDKESCHTAEIEGYFIEGHVPAEDIKRLIRSRPDAKGLIVPAMPIGSPGMERGGEFQPYDVLLVDKAGNTTVFAHHGK